MTREEQIFEHANSFKRKGIENDELKEIIRLAIIDGAKWADANPIYKELKGLDEAVEELYPDFSDDFASKAAVETVRNAFKAGAEWRDQQIPKLPNNLDEAAIEYIKNKYNFSDERVYNTIGTEDFKAGAEWMAEQGYTKETQIYANRWTDVDEVTVSLGQGEYGFRAGDKVIVQIHKK